MKMVHYGREDFYDSQERDIFVVFSQNKFFEKWYMLLTPLVLKGLQNDQIMKGNLDPEKND
jgi:hypothetical protein